MEEIFVEVGTKDPRYNTPVGIEFCLVQQLTLYGHKDPYLYQFCPIPISILHCIDSTSQGGTSQQQYISDLVYIGFFLLL